MNKMKTALTGAYQSTRDYFTQRRQAARLERLKTALEKRENEVLPIYERAVKKDPTRNAGHLEAYKKIKERIAALEESARNSETSEEKMSAAERVLKAIGFASEHLESAAEHISSSAIKRFIKISKEARDFLNEVVKGKKQ